MSRGLSDTGRAMTSTRITPPPRGTRPRNRRDLIRDTAAALFAEHGYDQVSLSALADAVNVGQSALYRHYSGKAELLYDATDVGLTRILTTLTEAQSAGPATMVAALVDHVLDDRSIGVLWQRESRNLPPAQRSVLRQKVRLANESLAAAVGASRPDLTAGQAELLAASAIDAATSISFHHLTVPRPEFETLLVDMCMRVLRLEPSRVSATRRATPRRAPASRPDELVDASIRLMAERGYAAVSIDDIGEAVGIAGPSVYKHFESKHDLLLEAMVRGTAQLTSDLDSAVARADSDDEPLRRISDAYVAMVLDHSDLIAVLIGETVHLDEVSYERTRKVQRAVIDDWVAQLRSRNPADDATVARIKVQAAQMVANDIARTPHLRRVPGFRQTILDICWELQQ